MNAVEVKNWPKGINTPLFSQAMPLQYTNIAVNPDGTLRPWPTHKTTTHPPVLKTDGQITWLPKEQL